MFSAGRQEGKPPRVAVTVCPSRLLAEEAWAEDFVEWWLWSVRWDGGEPRAPAWPFPGGLRKQPRRVFEACRFLRSEWAYLDRRVRDSSAPPPAES